jgi:hypothetical protein
MKGGKESNTNKKKKLQMAEQQRFEAEQQRLEAEQSRLEAEQQNNDNKFNNKSNKFDNNKFNNKSNNNNDNNGNASGKEKVSSMNTSSSNVPFEERELENATPENIERLEEKEKQIVEAIQEKEADISKVTKKKMLRMQKAERELNNSAKPIRTESESIRKKPHKEMKTGVLLNSAARNLLKLKKTMKKKDLTSGNLKNMNRLNLTLQEILRRQPTTKEEKRKIREIQNTIGEMSTLFNRFEQMRAKKSQNVINNEEQELARARMQVEREKAKVANAEIKAVEEEVNVNRARMQVERERENVAREEIKEVEEEVNRAQSKAELNAAKAKVNQEKLELAKAKADKQIANYRRQMKETRNEQIKIQREKAELKAFLESKKKDKSRLLKTQNKLSDKTTGILLNSASRNLLKLKKTMRKNDLTNGNLKNMNRLNLTLQEILRRKPTSKEEKRKIKEIQKTIDEMGEIFNRFEQMRAKRSQNKKKDELASARMQVEMENIAKATIKNPVTFKDELQNAIIKKRQEFIDKKGKVVTIRDMKQIRKDALREILDRLTPELRMQLNREIREILGEESNDNVQYASSSSGEPGRRVRL